VTVKGFKKCCISNAVDGTDDMLWNGSEEDGNVRTVSNYRQKCLEISPANKTPLKGG
jgi:hypothetical protein